VRVVILQLLVGLLQLLVILLQLLVGLLQLLVVLLQLLVGLLQLMMGLLQLMMILLQRLVVLLQLLMGLLQLMMILLQLLMRPLQLLLVIPQFLVRGGGDAKALRLLLQSGFGLVLGSQRTGAFVLRAMQIDHRSPKRSRGIGGIALQLFDLLVHAAVPDGVSELTEFHRGSGHLLLELHHR
jgi:hypothetical protein